MFATDGGNEIHDTLAKSGEKPVPQLSASFGETKGTLPAFSVSQVWALNRRVADYRTRYAQYWNSTASLTKSRRPVDAVLLPVAPSASFRPGEGVYFGTSVCCPSAPPFTVLPQDTPAWPLRLTTLSLPSPLQLRTRTKMPICETTSPATI